MIAVDTSSLVSFLNGVPGPDVNALRRAIESQILVLPPVVLTEIMSDPQLRRPVHALLKSIPLVGTDPGYWERAGTNRSKLLKMKLKTRVGDALIAQSCIDAKIPLITRDTDFRHFERLCGLEVIWGK
jgi:predicted nucleic acid-binding protein